MNESRLRRDWAVDFNYDIQGTLVFCVLNFCQNFKPKAFCSTTMYSLWPALKGRLHGDSYLPASNKWKVSIRENRCFHWESQEGKLQLYLPDK